MTITTEPAAIGIGGPTSSAWREDMLTRAHELQSLESWLSAHPDHVEPSGKLLDAVREHIDAARKTASAEDGDRHKRLWRAATGSSFERTLGNLDAVEVDLLRLAPSSYLRGALPSIQAHVNRFLSKDDPRRAAVDELASDPSKWDEHHARDVLVTAQHAANTQRRRNLIRLRGFRNTVYIGTVLFLGMATGLALLGYADKTAIPLCFAPEAEGEVTLVCPQSETPLGRADKIKDIDPPIAQGATKSDLLLIECIGLLAAALAGGVALRRLKATSTPYAVPLSLIILKLPTGALTAVVGLVLLRADFVPGLSALDTSAQILGWAVVFGIAQQFVTRIADSQASGLLEDVGGRGPAGDRPSGAQS